MFLPFIRYSQDMTQIHTIIMITMLLLLISMVNGAFYGSLSSCYAPDRFGIVMNNEVCGPIRDIFHISFGSTPDIILFYADTDDKAIVEACLDDLKANACENRIFPEEDDEKNALCWSSSNSLQLGSQPTCPQRSGEPCDQDTFCFLGLDCIDNSCAFPPLPDANNKILKVQYNIEHKTEAEKQSWYDFVNDKLPEDEFYTKECSYVSGTMVRSYGASLRTAQPAYSGTESTAELSINVSLIGILVDPDTCAITRLKVEKKLIQDYYDSPDYQPKSIVNVIYTTIPFQPQCWTERHQQTFNNCLDLSWLDECDFGSTAEKCQDNDTEEPSNAVVVIGLNVACAFMVIVGILSVFLL